MEAMIGNTRRMLLGNPTVPSLSLELRNTNQVKPEVGPKRAEEVLMDGSLKSMVREIYFGIKHWAILEAIGDLQLDPLLKADIFTQSWSI